MKQYEACIARACLKYSGIENFYYEDVPEALAYPSIYFPPAMDTSDVPSLNNYRNTYDIFAKVFARTRRSASEFADKIVQGIMKEKCLLPVYDKLGNETGEVLKIQPPSVSIIADGVAQITLEYSVILQFKTANIPRVKDIGINQHEK